MVTEKKDDRKTDDGTAGPRPQGGVHGDEHEVELKARAEFLRGNPVHVEKKDK